MRSLCFLLLSGNELGHMEFFASRHTEGNGLEYAKSEGLEIITLSPTEVSRWKEAVRPLLDDYAARMKAKGLPGRELLNEVLRLTEKYGQ